MKRKKGISFLIPERIVGAYDAKTHLSDLLADVERTGLSITITKNDRPVAQLRPVESDREERVHDLIERMRKARKGLKLKGLSLRSLIDEGRRI